MNFISKYTYFKVKIKQLNALNTDEAGHFDVG